MIKKIKLKNRTVVDLVTKTSTTMPTAKEAKKLFLAMTRVHNCTPSRVFAKARQRKHSYFVD